MSQQLRRGNWSVQELERLRLLLPHRGVAQTAGLLRRSAESVQRKALDILRVPPRRGDWTDSDDWQLRLAWGAVEPRLLGPMLGRPTGDVRRRAAELRRQMRSGPWTRTEMRLLKKLYGTRHDDDLEVCLLRDRREISAAAFRLCLAKDKRFQAAVSQAAAAQAGRGQAGKQPSGADGGDRQVPSRSRMPRWTAAEIRLLREIYADHDNLTVARKLGRSVTSVANKAYQIGVRKSPDLLTDIGRSNIAIRYQPVADGPLAEATTRIESTGPDSAGIGSTGTGSPGTGSTGTGSIGESWVASASQRAAADGD